MSTEYKSINELTVTTDLDDYAPGETAIISADYLELGATVEFQVQHVDGAGADGIYGTADDTIVDLGGEGHDSWTVIDGGVGDLDGEANGVIVTNWYVNPDDSLNEIFLLSASDGEATAYFSFTDGASYNLDQWANGADTGHLATDGDGWQNGNLNENQAHYYEGDFVPYRAILSDLTQGTYFITIEYDITQNGQHAIDYLGSYDASFGTGDIHEDDLTPDPLDGTGLTGGVNSTLEVALNPIVDAGPDGVEGTLDDIVQESGSISMFEGTLLGFALAGADGDFGTADDVYYLAGPDGTWGDGNEAIVTGWSNYATGSYTLNQDVSSETVGDAVYVTTGSLTGNAQQSVTVMYDYSGTNGEDAVLAWGGHIATNDDWDGQANPSGSPYHMRLIDMEAFEDNGDGIAVTGTGNQDRSLSRSAIVPSNPDLVVTKTADVGSVDEAGDVITYTIALDNTGDVALTNVSVNDPLLGALTGPSGDTDGDGELDVDEIWTYTGFYTVQQADIDSNGTAEPDDNDDNDGDLQTIEDPDGDIDNLVTVTADELDNPRTAHADVDIAQDPSMTVTKTATAINGDETDTVINAAGDIVTYEVVVTNTGNETLTNVAVTDPLTGLNETIVSLAPGASETFTTTYEVQQADIDSNGGGDADVDNTATAVDDRAGTETADEEVPLVTDPSMTVTKTATAINGDETDTVINAAGDIVTYEVVVTNTGNETLTNVAVTDPLTGLNETIVSLAPGASETFTTTYEVQQADIDSNGGGDADVDNTATAVDDRAGTETADEEVPLVTDPSMTVTKTATAINGDETDTVINAAGDIVTYEVVVTNTGNETLTNVAVTDPLTGLNETIVSLAPGASETFTTTYEVQQADIDSNGGGDADVDNTATAVDDRAGTETADEEVPLVTDPSMTVTKTATAINGDETDTVINAAGDIVTYEVVVTNTGNETLTNVAVTDPLTGLNETIVSLAPGASETFTTTYEVQQADIDSNGGGDADVDNTATAVDDRAGTETADEEVPLVTDPSMTVTKTATAINGDETDTVINAAGDIVTYEVVVTNTGNETLTNVAVTDPLTGLNETIVSLAPGASETFTTTYEVQQADIDSNGGGDADVDNTATAVDDRAGTETADEEVPLVTDPSMTVTKTATAINGDETDTVINAAGDIVTYEVVVTNTGNETLTNVAVTDPLTGLNETIVSLAPGASETFTTTYEVQQADIDSNGGGDADVDNTATAVDDRAGTETADEEVPLVTDPSMTVTKTATAINGDETDTVINAAGDIVTYEVVVTNTGNETLTNVAVTDPLTGLNETIVSLAPGASETFTTTYEVQQADIDSNGGGDADVDNTATAVDDRAGTETADEEVPLVTDPSMTVTKTATAINGDETDTVINAAGDIVTYEVVVTNTGNETLTNVAVTDPLTGLNETIVSLAPGASETFTTTYEVQQADIDSNGGGDADVDNTATAVDDRAGTETADEEVPLVTDPSMTVTKTATAINGDETDTVINAAGDIVTYEVVVTNTGNETLTNVAVTDPLTGLNETIVSLAPGASETFTTTYEVQQADIDSNGGGDADVDNTATAVDDRAGTETADEEVPLVTDPSMTVTKTATAINGDETDTVINAAGDIVTYEVVVTNTGNETLTNVAVTDPLTGLNETIVSLAPGASETFTTTYEVQQADIDSNGGGDADVDNTATAVDDRAGTETADEEVPLVTDPSMTVTKTATAINGDETDTVINAAGDIVTYEVVVTNTGNETLTNVAVTDPLTGLNETIVSLAPGASETFTTTYEVQQADIDSNGGGDADVDNTATAVDDRAGTETADEEVPLVTDPSMTVTKTATAINGDETDTVINAAGDIVTYEVVVTNTGNETLTNVAVTDPLTGLNETIVSLAPGASETFTTTYEVQQADIDSNGGGDADVDNTATAVDDRAGTETADEEVPLVTDPSMTVTKTATAINGDETDTVINAAGDIVTYEVVVTNTGNETLTNVAVTDPLTGLNETIVSLAPGASETFTTTYEVQQADIDSNGGGDADVDNTATAVDDRAGTETADEEVPLVTDPSMTVTKTATAINGDETDTVINAAGDIVTYEVVVTNTGNETLTNVAVTDPLTGLNETIVSLAPGASETFTTTYEVQQADIDSNGGGDADVDNTATAVDDRAGAVDDSEEVTVVLDPAIELLKDGTFEDENDNGVAEVGETITYTFTVTNTGNVALFDVIVTDPKVEVLGGPITLGAGEIDDTTFTASYAITQDDIDAGLFYNLATATGADPSQQEVEDDDDHTENLVQPDPSISIDKVTVDEFASSGDGIVVFQGAGVSWLYTVENTGNVTLENLVVEDSDPGVTPVGIDADDDGFFLGDDADDTDDSVGGDGSFDAGDIWYFSAEGTAIDIPVDEQGKLERQYTKYENTGTATGTFGDATVEASDDSSYYVIQRGYVTDSSLCRFGNDFVLNFTPDNKAGFNEYKLSGSNPGQFYYNLFFDASEAEDGKVTLNIPYPFELQGANPIHAYSDVTLDGLDADTLAEYDLGADPLCFTPGDELDGALSWGVVGDGMDGLGYVDKHGDAIAENYQIEVLLPEGTEGFVYLNVHLDYSLEGTGPWEKVLQEGWGADAVGDAGVVDILDFTQHAFSSSIDYSTDHVWNDNRFHGPKWKTGSDEDEKWYGHHGKDHYHAEGGDDHVYGRGGADVLWGGWGKDKVYGNGGRDFICGGEGNDKMWGGRGSDTFLFRDGDGRDKVFDFDAKGRDHDIIDLSLVSDIKGWKDLKNNHLEEVDKGVWIRGDSVDVFLKGCDLGDLDKADFLL